MKNKRRMQIESNKGYSLVEMIIVICIIAILSGLAAVTVSAIKSAEATSAKETFNQELSALQNMSKAQEAGMAMKLTLVDNNYEITFGTCSDYQIKNFVEDTSKDKVVLEKTRITYAPEGGQNFKTNSEGALVEVVIKFNKSDGSVASGSGVYTFCKQNSNKSVGKVTLNMSSGSHYTGS